MKESKKCVAIGASAGGVQALQKLVSALPADLAIPVFVVLHIPPYRASKLGNILDLAGPLPAVHPDDGTRITGGVIYVASPDHHLLIDDGKIAIKRGPKENRFRPSIDALFRSAAFAYGSGAIGVILSGALDDGASGIWSIKRLGGIAIVQEPNEALIDSMPRSAMEYVTPDHILTCVEIGQLLGQLAMKPSPPAPEVDEKIRSLMEKEIQIAADGGAFQKGIMELGKPTPFTCPECHGALVKVTEGKMSRFRCHTGHAFSDSALLEGVMESTGEMLWQVIRSLEEGVMLLNSMGNEIRLAGDPDRAEVFFQKAREIKMRSESFHHAALTHESLSSENIGQYGG
jgi:two-component system, chemotaxis family, protein-glutamate methylesterase/glutaminase